MPRSRALLAALLTCLGLTVALLGSPSQAADQPGPQLPPIPAVPGLPIPSLPTDLLVPSFIGRPATSHPVKQQPLPQSIYTSPNGTNGIHNDPYSSDAYAVSGPLGKNLQVSSRSYGVRECATISFDSRGDIIGLCGGLEGFTMMLIDPVTLEAMDQITMSTRDLTTGANPFTDICGGTYFFLDPFNRAFATTARRSIIEVDDSVEGLYASREWDLSSHVAEGDCLVATGVDWKGLVWFVTQQGTVGTLNRVNDAVRTVQLGKNEGIFNSISEDETGGVYLVTTKAMYRMDAKNGKPTVTWRRAYDRGSEQKPGMLSQGSGTSPTLIGRRWVAITDNHDPRTRVVVYDRRLGVSKREHCATAIFPKGASTTENSLVAVGNSLIAENNYGYEGVPTTTMGRTTTPGISRVVITRKGCRVAWQNNTVVAPTSVPKASLGNGLLYAYTKPARADGIDAWYLSALDVRTGKVVWSQLTGTGVQWNNHYSAIYLGPDGAAYVATLAGLVRIQDGT